MIGFKMGVLGHESEEKRALRYRRGACREDEYDKALYQDALDETGTVNTEALIDSIHNCGSGRT